MNDAKPIEFVAFSFLQFVETFGTLHEKITFEEYTRSAQNPNIFVNSRIGCTAVYTVFSTEAIFMYHSDSVTCTNYRTADQLNLLDFFLYTNAVAYDMAFEGFDF